ncbi:putative T-complex 11 protein [Helianthus anomalus]
MHLCPGYVHVQGIQQTLTTQCISLWEPLGAFGLKHCNILYLIKRAYWGTPKTPVRMIQSLRSCILLKAQLRLAKLDQLRQAARTGVEVRVKKERAKLGTKVELRVRQAE